MHFWKNKKGEKLSFKEFIKHWQKGVEGITPLQSIKTQMGGTKITMLGMFLGLCVSIYGWRNLWWVGIILIGALLNTGIQFLGLRQQKKLLVNLEEQFKETDEDDKDSQETNLEDVGEGDTFKTHALKKSKSSLDTSNSLEKEKEVKQNE